MDRSDEFRVIVKRVFHEIALMTPTQGDVRTELVCDEASGHCHLGEIGWEGQRRVDTIILHADVIDGKVWFQYNGTDLRVADMLMDAGIPRENIILAFHPADLRVYTDFAVA